MTASRVNKCWRFFIRFARESYVFPGFRLLDTSKIRTPDLSQLPLSRF